MAAPSRAIIVQTATSCVPSTTPGGEELMDVASAAVSVTDKSKRQTRTQRALPASAAAMEEARRQNAREEIHDSKRRRMESEQLEDDADIRKAASLQAVWSSHDPEEGFEGDELWERATTRSRRKAAQREQGNSTRPARVAERTELGCFVSAIRPRERRSIVSLNALEVKQAISALSHDKRLAQHQLQRFNDASNTLTVQTCDERPASDLLKLNTLEIPWAPPLPVSVHQVPSEGMSRGVVYGCTLDETSKTLAKALDSENVQILLARPMGNSGLVLIIFASSRPPRYVKCCVFLKNVIPYEPRSVHEEPPESCPQTDKKYCRNCERDGHLATDPSCQQRKLFAKHAKAAQGHQSRKEIAKELEQIDMETEVSSRDFENTLSRLQKQLSEIQRSKDTARTRFYLQVKERNAQKLVLQHRQAEWKEERMLIDQAKRRQSLSPRRGSAPPPKNTRPYPMNGGKLKNPPQEPSKEETGGSVEVVQQAYRAPEWITQFLNDTRAPTGLDPRPTGTTLTLTGVVRTLDVTSHPRGQNDASPSERGGHLPEEFLEGNGWCTINTRPNLTARPRRATPRTEPTPTPARERTATETVRVNSSIVIRPRGGLDVATTGTVRLASAIYRAANVPAQEAAEDTVCSNNRQNIIVVSTPHTTHATKYRQLEAITISDRRHEVSAYETAPDYTVKGIIRGIPLEEDANRTPRRTATRDTETTEKVSWADAVTGKRAATAKAGDKTPAKTETEIAKLTQAIQALQKQIEHIQTQIRAKDELIEQLQHAVNSAIRDARIHALEARLSNLEATIIASITRTIQQSLESVHLRLSRLEATNSTIEHNAGRQMTITNWNQLRKHRDKQQVTDIKDIDQWTDQLRRDIERVTQTNPSKAGLDTIDSRVLHVWEDKTHLQRRWKQQRHNRRMRKRIAQLNKEIEKHALTQQRQQWEEKCAEMDSQLTTRGTWQMLRHLIDPASTKTTHMQGIYKIIHAYGGTEQQFLLDAERLYISQTPPLIHPDYTGESNATLDAELSVAEIQAALILGIPIHEDGGAATWLKELEPTLKKFLRLVKRISQKRGGAGTDTARTLTSAVLTSRA
ncbi:hypothetical protein HPB49_010692 [Dermacentor silvarum]|uniref:Uncharacterized protein n=1 Tax=Dermacentor silvarum TaxID=543639 RepID=A0ACB8CKF5_DERSI|nr:hypothetical protein HPB49_010692 [Dermacentor silvarum]